MYICDRCGKGSQYVMNVSHSHRRTQKTNLPNLHKVSVSQDGQRVSLRLCSKCTRIVKALNRAQFALKTENAPASV